MREILFRGKSKDTGKWIYGDLLQYADSAQIWVQTDGGKWNYIIDPETVCQYTGKGDKYATKIFENSIIKESSYGCIGVIKFGEYEKGYGFYIEWASENAKFYREDLSYWIKKAMLVVIGNIFDNPELLKGAQND